jgi:hypothetical protein
MFDPFTSHKEVHPHHIGASSTQLIFEVFDDIVHHFHASHVKKVLVPVKYQSKALPVIN